jgi:hypothetical protein
VFDDGWGVGRTDGRLVGVEVGFNVGVAEGENVRPSFRKLMQVLSSSTLNAEPCAILGLVFLTERTDAHRCGDYQTLSAKMHSPTCRIGDAARFGSLDSG